MSFFQAICLWLLQERILNQLLIEHPQTYPHRREASQVWDLRKKLHCQLQPLLPQDDPYQGWIWFLKKVRSGFFHGLFSGQTSPMSRMSKVFSYARWFAASFKNPLFFPFLLSFHLSTATLCTKLPITAFTNDRSHGTEGSHCQFVQDHLRGKTFHLFPKG